MTMNTNTAVVIAAFAAAIAIAIFVPASASANAGSGTAVWNGQSGAFANECTFQKNNPGTMVLNGTTWNNTVPAEVKLKTRNVNNVKVTSDNKLRLQNGTIVDDAVVNYIGSTVVGGPAQMVRNINSNEIAVGNIKSNGASVFTINIAGKAEMDDTDELSSNTNYKIQHTVTCLQ